MRFSFLPLWILITLVVANSWDDSFQDLGPVTLPHKKLERWGRKWRAHIRGNYGQLRNLLVRVTMLLL